MLSVVKFILQLLLVIKDWWCTVIVWPTSGV